jgi:predicted DsbA family dithiol-disulfide isomerase
MSQTTRAHRLCQKAYKIGGQNFQIPLLCAVFKAHMEDAKDIADINVLAELAESTGTMSKAEVCSAFSSEQMFFQPLTPFSEQAVAFLESDELEKEVNSMCDEARSKGITGVPMTIIDGKWAVSGGQSSDVFIQVHNLSQSWRKSITEGSLFCQIFKKLAAAGVHNAPSPFSGPVADTLVAV